MPSTHRDPGRTGYLLAKQIDGHSGQEWTYVVFGSRVRALRLAGPATMFYEPLSTFDQAFAAAFINMDQRQSGAQDDVLHNVSVGLRWYRSGFYAEGGRLPGVTADDEFVGLHVVAVVGLEGNDTLVLLNRWEGWGDSDQCGYLTRQVFDGYAEEVWLNRPSTVGLSPEQARDMSKAIHGPLAGRLEAVRQAWVKRRPISSTSVLIDDRVHTLYTKQVTSARTKRTVILVEIRHEVFGGVARGHVHVGGDQPAEIEEIFVWPDYRRRGYGSYLLLDMLRLARERTHHEATAPIYDGDLLSVNGPAAEAFLHHHDFRLRRVDERRPRCQRRGTLDLG